MLTKPPFDPFQGTAGQSHKPDDPLVALWQRREALHALTIGSNIDADRCDEIADQMTEIDEEIIATPASSLAGVRVKALAMADYIGISDDLAAPLDAGMMLSLLKDIERFAGGAS